MRWREKCLKDSDAGGVSLAEFGYLYVRYVSFNLRGN